MAADEERQHFKRPNPLVWCSRSGNKKRKTGLSPPQKWLMMLALPLLTGSCLQLLAPGYLSKALASVHLFPSCLSSCIGPCETNPKGWRAGTHLGHFPAGFTGWWRHTAKVHHFTWTFCLPGFTMAFEMGLSTLPQGQPALPCGVSGKSCSWSMSRVPRAMRPSTPGCLEPN